MLKELLKKVAHADEFYTELKSILCVLSKEEKEVADKLLNQFPHFQTVDDIEKYLSHSL